MAAGTRKQDTMNLERFSHLLQAYGGNPQAWPADERELALQFMSAHPEASAMLEQACALDALLELAPVHEPSRALRDRVLASARRKPSWSQRLDRWASGLWPFGRSWQPMAALAAAAALGIAAGALVPNSDIEADPYGTSGLSLGDFGDFGDTP